MVDFGYKGEAGVIVGASADTFVDFRGLGVVEVDKVVVDVGFEREFGFFQSFEFFLQILL